MKWIKVTDRLPDEDTICLVSCRIADSKQFPKYTTHPLSAEWNGKEWVDIEGETVKNVEYWCELPTVNKYVGVIEKIEACVANDACEETDCCYFTKQRELSALLKYIKDMEERQ